MKRVLRLALAGIYVFGASVFGEESNPIANQVYLSPGILHYEAPGTSRHNHDGFTSGALIVGYGINENLAVEILVGGGESDWSNSLGSGEDDVVAQWVDLLYKLPAGSSEVWQPFVIGGVGRTEFDFNSTRPPAVDTQFNVGLGAFRHFTDVVSLRADVRAMTSERGGMEPAIFLGLTGFFGGDRSPPPPPPDSDGDGVVNASDRCPTTPPGRTVDENGCQLDSDGDGVVDFDDRCPDTPEGVQVDSRGCPLDSDGDGVPDFRDDCPDTERGARVDERGCYIELTEEVTIDMNIEFDTNMAEIRPDHRTEIGRVVQFLREYPTANAVIEGHTDSDGSAAYNQALSERRAKAVYDYLIGESGVDAARLSYEGHGETRPKASNDTAQGKQENRRVSAVVSGSRTVRQ